MTSPLFAVGVSLDVSTCACIAEHLAERIGSAGLHFEDTTSESERWLTAEQAGAYIGVTRQRIADLTYSKRLAPAGYDGRSPRYRRADLDAYLRNGH